MLRKRQIVAICAAVGLALFAAGCKKKVAPAPPPPPPPPPPIVQPAKPAAPVISQFSAEPTEIQRGQSATLRWSVTGEATSIAIDQGLGTVPAAGTRRVFPNDSLTYTLTASGPGGNVTRSASVTVTAPPPAPAPAPPPVEKVPLVTRLANEVQDAMFDYDKSDIREDARAVLTRNAEALKNILNDFPGATIAIEGHCDDRGSAEYNLGLGDRRATAAKDFLTQLGVAPDKLKTISYGKERPQCTDASEGCWQRNRRAHFAPGQ
jgi:peptidoglycan-associated lipoprotein